MPKEWSRHKAAIARLYIDEGRTLKEVKDILYRDYGFKASYDGFHFCRDS